MKSNAPPSPGSAADWSAESEVSNAGLAGVESAASRAYRDGSASMRVICARAAGGPFITPASSADRSSAPLMASGFCWPAVPEPKAPGKSWPRFISWLWLRPAWPEPPAAELCTPPQSWARFIAWLAASAGFAPPMPVSAARFTWCLMRGSTWCEIRFWFTSA